MPIVDTRIAFARLHWHQSLFADEESVSVEDAAEWLEALPAVIAYNYTWRADNINVRRDEDAVTGRLGKIHETTHEETVWDEQRHGFYTSETTDEEAVCSAFALHLPTGIIAFRVLPGDIAGNTFINRFNKMAGQSEDVRRASVEPVLDEQEAMERIRTISKLESIHFKLVPTNPGAEEEFRHLDQFLRSANPTDAQLILKNKDEGLNPDGDAVKEPASMVAAGYGSWSGKGQADGATRIINSKQGQLLQEVHELPEEDEEGFSARVIGIVREKFGLQ